jgi:hypothetical protein
MRTSLVPTIYAALSILFFPNPLSPQEPPGSGEVLVPLRTETPLVIDGRLDDPVWREAPFVTDFRTWTPDFGQTMVGETRTYMAYDGSNLYFAFHAFDPEP